MIDNQIGAVRNPNMNVEGEKHNFDHFNLKDFPTTKYEKENRKVFL